MSRQWQRSRRCNRHHMIPRSRGGHDGKRNIIRLDTERHNAWHFLFGDMSFEEIAKMLLRAIRMKQSYYNWDRA